MSEHTPERRSTSGYAKKIESLIEQRDSLRAVNAELLEALKRCKDHLSGPTAWTQEEEDLLLGRVSAAIAKAQGEQP